MTLKIRVVDAVIPRPMIEMILNPSDEGKVYHERKLLSAAAFVVKLLRETNKSFIRLRPKHFDAEPGDRACHTRDFILRGLFLSAALKQEVIELDPLCQAVYREINERKSRNGQGIANDDPIGFFQRKVCSLEVSRELFYLVNCRLLTIVKGVAEVLPNGIRLPKTYAGRLMKISKKLLNYFGSFGDTLIGDAGARLSQDSIEFLQRECSQLPCTPLTKRMLFAVRQNQPKGEFSKKSFGCMQLQIEALLLQLRMKRALVGIQTLVVSGTPQLIFFQFNGLEEAKEFSRLKAREVRSMPRETLISVFQGVIPCLERCAAAVEKHGFAELIRVCASQEDPFEPGSTLNDVADVEARELIEKLRGKAKELKCLKEKNPVILIWHVFLCSRQELLPDPARGKSI